MNNFYRGLRTRNSRKKAAISFTNSVRLNSNAATWRYYRTKFPRNTTYQIAKWLMEASAFEDISAAWKRANNGI